MKVKKLLIPLLLLMICMLALSACSNATLYFDENSTVKLSYNCADEEKNFSVELNAEQSNDLILSLNKITYAEVKEHIDFGPSYDRLRIDIGNDYIDLYDVWGKINNGGYFYYNGKFCESKENFGFLKPYLTEYDPNIITNSVSFGVQYVKSTVGAKENHQIIKSVKELDNYIATQIRDIDLPDIVLFKDEVIAKYSDEYFENSFIVIFMRAASSGSYDFRVDNVYISSDRLIIDYEIIRPSDPDVGVTCDMAYWYSFVELNNEYNTIKYVDLLSQK